MTDTELTKMLRSSANGVVNYAADRIEQLTAERDAAYASGYSDAETEISKSALGQRNDFLHSQYANAVDHIKVLTEQRDKAHEDWREYEGAWMAAEGKLADAEALIEAQAKDHASNNIRFAEAEHRAKAAEAERDHAWAMVEKADTQMGQSLADHLQAKAERDRLREALEHIISDCEADYPPSHGAIKYAAKLALKGETP